MTTDKLAIIGIKSLLIPASHFRSRAPLQHKANAIQGTILKRF